MKEREISVTEHGYKRYVKAAQRKIEYCKDKDGF